MQPAQQGRTPRNLWPLRAALICAVEIERHSEIVLLQAGNVYCTSVEKCRGRERDLPRRIFTSSTIRQITYLPVMRLRGPGISISRVDL